MLRFSAPATLPSSADPRKEQIPGSGSRCITDTVLLLLEGRMSGSSLSQVVCSPHSACSSRLLGVKVSPVSVICHHGSEASMKWDNLQAEAPGGHTWVLGCSRGHLALSKASGGGSAVAPCRASLPSTTALPGDFPQDSRTWLLANSHSAPESPGQGRHVELHHGRSCTAGSTEKPPQPW